MTSPDDDPAAFREYVREELARRLRPRTEGAAPHLYGIRDDDTQRLAGREFLLAFADLGWATPHWPASHGGAGFSPAQASIIGQELAAFDVPDLYPYDVGLRMVASVLFKHGTPEQRQRWLTPIRLGAQVWCQLFSEPEAGSDLASRRVARRVASRRVASRRVASLRVAALRCGAVRTGNGWRLSGRKTWSSRATYAQWGLLLARSDPEAERHHGITAFAVPMSAAGVTVSPIKQMNGDEHFAEVRRWPAARHRARRDRARSCARPRPCAVSPTWPCAWSVPPPSPTTPSGRRSH